MTSNYTMNSFEWTGIPSKVIFGAGKIDTLPDILSNMNLHRCIILTTPNQRHLGEHVAALIGRKAAATFNRATMHTPLHITEQAMKVATEAQVDSTVSIGGGSTTGLGKALAIRLGISQICIPTTYAGSEMTPTLGETTNGRKTTRRDETIRPNVVIYDVSLTLKLPVKTSLTSGMNAIAHAVESLYSKEINPLIQHYAAEGIRHLSHALPEIKQDPESMSARTSAQYGAWLCAMCLGSTKMGLHHKMCHAIGGALNLSHAETHTVVLPRALAYNAPAVLNALQVIGDALPCGDGDAVRGLHMLVEKLDLPNGLHEIGMKESDVDVVVEQIMASGYENPVTLELEKVERLTRACFEGTAYQALDHAGNHRL